MLWWMYLKFIIMKTELENTELRKVIDISYQSGIDICLEEVIKWVKKNIENYIWFDESEIFSGNCCGVEDEFETDLRNSIKQTLKK